MTPEEINNLLDENQIGSYLSFGIENMKVLCELAKELPEKPSILEIGTLEGRSACAWALATGGRVYTVDKKDRGQVYANIKKLNLEDRVHYIVSSSQDFDIEQRFDLIFIDGGHSYENAMHDIKKFTPFARHIVCGHDYNEQFLDVKRAVDDFFGELVENNNTIWVLKKQKVLK